MSVNFSNRSSSIEIMDDLECQGEVVLQTLRELDFINHWLGGNSVTIQGLTKNWESISKENEIVIADLGCGSGEMLRLISNLATKENRKVKLIGFDANPHIVEYAKDHSREFQNISFEALNVFSADFKNRKFDVVLATLFMHHFSKEELVMLFSSLKSQTNLMIIVNDIHRHALAYYSIKWLTRLLSHSSMVKFDAPISVLRAFKKTEFTEVLSKAGINQYHLTWKWAFRWQLIIPVQGN